MSDTELVEWTRAAIAAVRKAAETAAPGPWSIDTTKNDGGVLILHETDLGPDDHVVYTAADDDETMRNLVHIVMHDPLVVLDGCDADLAILDEALSWRHLYLDDDGWYSCAQAINPHEENAEPGSGCMNERAGGPCDCGVDNRRDRIVKAVASRYRHQVPGWQEGWAT